MTDAAASKSPTFILASQSPRRKQLLTEAGYCFGVTSPPIDEPATAESGSPPAQQAESLAYFKARSVVDACRPQLPVLGADTVVALGGRTFGKARDAAHAREIVTALGGTRHQVITGVALIDPSGVRLIASDVTHVHMRAMSPAEMDAYIIGGQWEGKAGAYGIQDAGDAFVERIEGSFTNVVGMPMELLSGLFAQLVARRAQ